MWNQFLNESKSERKFENTPLIILGNRHSGKRSLVDSLFDISKTTLHAKRLATHTDNNKMRLKGLTPVVDYAYLNVLDINDPDYRTHSKLEVYMVEDRYNTEVFAQLQKPELLKKAVVIIMLDFTNPWSFLEELDSWIKFLYELQKNAGFGIGQLEEMAEKVAKYYKNFKQPEFDENGKVKISFHVDEDEQNQQQIPQGTLQSNIRLPFLICVNKCDLQSSVLREQSSNKILFIMYHLRKYCVKYGGSLIYTSIKNNSNLNVLYEYILHRSYNTPLRYKPEAINQQAIFIPLGFDRPAMIEDSVVKMDMSRSYGQMIAAPVSKKVNKEEIIVEEDAQFFKKYIGLSSNASSTSANASISKVGDQNASGSSSRTAEVTKFFQKLLKNQPEEQKRTAAQNDLLRHTNMQASLNKTGDKKAE